MDYSRQREYHYVVSTNCRRIYKKALRIFKDVICIMYEGDTTMKILEKGLIVQSATMNELDKMNQAHKEAQTYFSFDLKRSITPPIAYLSESKDALPVGVSKDNMEILACYTPHSFMGTGFGGYLTFYRSYPGPKSVYIDFFYLREFARDNGYGTTMINGLLEQLRQEGFSQVIVAVSLKNWRGLNFWMKLGFQNIMKIEYDKDCEEGGLGTIELQMALV